MRPRMARAAAVRRSLPPAPRTPCRFLRKLREPPWRRPQPSTIRVRCDAMGHTGTGRRGLHAPWGCRDRETGGSLPGIPWGARETSGPGAVPRSATAAPDPGRRRSRRNALHRARSRGWRAACVRDGDAERTSGNGRNPCWRTHRGPYRGFPGLLLARRADRPPRDSPAARAPSTAAAVQRDSFVLHRSLLRPGREARVAMSACCHFPVRHRTRTSARPRTISA